MSDATEAAPAADASAIVMLCGIMVGVVVSACAGGGAVGVTTIASLFFILE